MIQLKLTGALIITMFTCIGISAKEKDPTIINHEITIEASIDDAWEILGPQFQNAQIWASSVKHSEALNNESLNGSNTTVRGCAIKGMGEIKETLLSYSPNNYSLSYVVKEGMPKMVKHASNNWQLIDLGNGKTKLKMKIEMKTGGFMGWMMRGMMKRKMTKLSSQIAEEFKYYVENGKPHPRKIKANKKS
ncbi:SRPBCC family protein [Thalassobellus citreus]|uniref:SRPBCC family protein n=1 Tax=Thalassobellus citreus TaxID=3367752 RepID=UPI00378A246B